MLKPVYIAMMLLQRSQILGALSALKPELEERFGVATISLFGSYARGEAGPTSDVDLLVGFTADARPTYFSLSRLSDFLESVLGKKIDLLTDGGINPRIEPYIREDLIDA